MSSFSCFQWAIFNVMGQWSITQQNEQCSLVWKKKLAQFQFVAVLHFT